MSGETGEMLVHAPTSPYYRHATSWRAAQEQTCDATADQRERHIKTHAYYYGHLKEFLTFVVEEGKRVLCVKSDVGQYLEWVKPSRGVGVENSAALVEIGRRRCPQYEFIQADPEALPLSETFDYILIPNGVNTLFDVHATLSNLRARCEPDTRVVIVFYNFLWQPLVVLAETLGWKVRQPPLNWLSLQDMAGMLDLSGFEVVREYRLLLVPVYIPLLSWFANRILARLPLFNRISFVHALVARPGHCPPRVDASVSVVIPCRNEAGNIEAAVQRTPDLGTHTEIIFCDDRSTDGTADEVRRLQALHPERDIKLVTGPGIGKAENVWTGFDVAGGDILMILDADLAVPPEELPKFYAALVDGRGDFINGSRMVYPMEAQAMRLLNVFGNKVFSLLFSHILGQPIKDTLCGTKVLWRRDYHRLRAFRGSWGIADRWGDYELIFGAARCNLKLVDLPVHYMERVYGETKMNARLRNATVMLRMCLAASRRFR